MKETEKTVKAVEKKEEGGVKFFDGRQKVWKISGKKISIYDGLNPKGKFTTFEFTKQIWTTREKGKNFFCLVLFKNGDYILLKKSLEIK